MLTDALGTSFDELAPKFARANGHTIHEVLRPVRRRWCGGSTPASPPTSSCHQRREHRRADQAEASCSRAAPTSPAPASASRCARARRKPDVSTPEALKRALLAAKSIGYTDPAGGGLTAAPHHRDVSRSSASREQMAPKTKLAAGGPTGRVSTLVANGEAEIGMQMVSELLSNPELEVIGMLPPELQLITVYSAGITANAKEPDAARALVRFLATPEAAVGLQGQRIGTLTGTLANGAAMRAIIALAALLLAAGAAHAAEIKALISTAMKAPFQEIAAQFEKATGHKVSRRLWPDRRPRQADRRWRGGRHGRARRRARLPS